MSKDKQAASEAVNALRTYLKNDPKGKDLLKAVQQFQVNLRKANGEMREDAKKEKARADLADSKVAPLTARAEELETQVDKLQRENVQLRSRLATAERARDTLAADLGPRDPPGRFEFDEPAAFYALAKSLRRRLPTAPRTQGYAYARELFVIELSDVVRGYNADEYTSLGMFITLMALAGFPIGAIVFEDSEVRDQIPTDDLIDAGTLPNGADSRRKLVRYLKDWFDVSGFTPGCFNPSPTNAQHMAAADKKTRDRPPAMPTALTGKLLAEALELTEPGLVAKQHPIINNHPSRLKEILRDYKQSADSPED